MISTYDSQGLHFHFSDWLGSRRVQTDYAGNPQGNWQNFPFGEGLTPATLLGASEHHFTGKERDADSSLDYFGVRYYGSSMGRWMSPAWADKPEAIPYSSLDNPQSLNLYGYEDGPTQGAQMGIVIRTAKTVRHGIISTEQSAAYYMSFR
ncbi:RHS repeat-associated core domain-containing protein [Granulicella sp. S190]|uniref:RHS repeat-associated core domain-containing protein n=1 Tax=Granulicella sp. S190 TaxID=1747226 RepID=UPI00131C8CD2